MKSYPLRHLYRYLGQALETLPFAITNRNVVVAIVARPGDIKPGILREAKKSQ